MTFCASRKTAKSRALIVSVTLIERLIIMKFNGIVTLYNTVEVDFKKTLVPRLLEGVYVEKTRGAEKAAEGDKNADNLRLIVSFK